MDKNFTGGFTNFDYWYICTYTVFGLPGSKLSSGLTFTWFTVKILAKIEILGGKVLKNNFPCKFLACPGQNLCVQGADV
jgi:hypothetical protein